MKTLVDNIYYYQDELGSTSHVANSSGALLESYRYNLYGAPTFWSASSSQLPSSNYNVAVLGNGGSRWMPELGLYDDRNRFTSPDLGRFLQPDPIGFKGDASNLHRYCGNDWANRTDPMGTEGTPPPEGPNLIGFERQMAEDRAKASDNRSFQEKLMAWETHMEKGGSVKPDAFSAEVRSAIANGPKFAQNSSGDPRSETNAIFKTWKKAAEDGLNKAYTEVQASQFSREYTFEIGQKKDGSANSIHTTPHPGAGRGSRTRRAGSISARCD